MSLNASTSSETVKVHAIEPGRPFDRVYDVDAIATLLPSNYTVKGMYMTPLVRELGPSYAAVAAKMLRPAPNGRYVAFKDYPQSDHSRLLFAVADKLHPHVANSEGMRRIARNDVRTFAESTLGRVTLSLVSDARAALHKLPFVYGQVAKGDWTFDVEDVDADRVRLTLLRNYGAWEYQAGQFEGVVMHFGASPRMRVTELGEGGFSFEIRVR